MVVRDWDKFLTRRYELKEKELTTLEKRLAEYDKLYREPEPVIRAEEDYYRFVRRMRLKGFEGYYLGRLEDVPAPIYPAATSDWDFENASWVLQTSLYHSSPSCLEVQGGIPPVVVSRYSTTLDLAEGRVLTWWYPRNNDSGWHPRCRDQSSLGSIGTNYYDILMTADPSNFDWYVRCMKPDQDMLATGSSYLNNYKFNDPYNSWYHSRVTWWVSGTAILIRLEKEDGDLVWDKLINDANDTNNRWETSGTNRVGITTRQAAAYVVYMDDTEIWG